jgi:hypothetical protein
MSILSQDQVSSVRKARWEAWQRLAKELPEHHILAVELLRVDNDETAAVFTVVRERGVVQHVVRADARGRIKAPGKPQTDQRFDRKHEHKLEHKLELGGLELGLKLGFSHDHTPGQDHGDHGHGGGDPGGRGDDDCGPGTQRSALMAQAQLRPTEEAVDANAIALGEPPPKDPPPPGITSLASVLLASAFDVGEQLVGK